MSKNRLLLDAYSPVSDRTNQGIAQWKTMNTAALAVSGQTALGAGQGNLDSGNGQEPVLRLCERSRFGFAKVTGGFIGFALNCATRPGTRKPPIQVFRERLGSRCFSKRDICSSNGDYQGGMRGASAAIATEPIAGGLTRTASHDLFTQNQSQTRRPICANCG